MIAHDSWWSNENVFQLSSTIINYHAPFERGFRKAIKAFIYGKNDALRSTKQGSCIMHH